MKRIIAYLLVLILLLSGCVFEESDTPVTPQPPSQSDTSQPSDNEGTASDGEGEKEPDIAPAKCGGHESDPYVNVDKEAFYASYSPACCYQDACYRTQHFLLSGYKEVPGQYAEPSSNQPMAGSAYIRNTDQLYSDDGNTYTVVDSSGRFVGYIYKGAAYITLEEVAAYMYAFGGSNDTLPANYTSKKATNVGTSPWGEYLRSNHSYFKGDTNKYPYEPKLPNISGCGGDLKYYELDIGTTGTETPGYVARPYNNGSSITRGAARIVYARQDLNDNGVYEDNEVYVFYTHNHYNDFREYLNYYGGWGEVFGNMTGGGEYSSKTNYNPTPYPETVNKSFAEK